MCILCGGKPSITGGMGQHARRVAVTRSPRQTGKAVLLSLLGAQGHLRGLPSSEEEDILCAVLDLPGKVRFERGTDGIGQGAMRAL
jgi:hypothetical protein